MNKKRVFLKIYGQVQGVNYRYYTQKEGLRLRLSGWVKNEIDGTVVVEAEGNKKQLEALVDWCYKGPSSATVEKIDILWSEYKGDLSKFEIKF